MQRSDALMRRPVLLRFASDSFMEDLQALLADDPTRLLGLVAQPESWRSPAVGLTPLPAAGNGNGGGAGGAASGTGPAAATGGGAQPGSVDAQPPQLTLYQPVHQRFYLVAAVLVCRMPGLPERTVLKSAGERVGFVLRRVQPFDTGSAADLGVPGKRRSFAWVPGQPTGSWLEATEGVPLADEERLALFPMDSPRLGRQLWAGLVPVSRRQSYGSGAVIQAATQATTATGPTASAGGSGSTASAGGPAGAAATAAPDAAAEAAAVAAQLLDFQRDVLEPWGDLDDWLFETWSPRATEKVRAYYDGLPAGDPNRVEFDHSVQLTSALILADFAGQMGAHLPKVWQALGAGSDSGLGSAAGTLYDQLRTPAADGTTLYDAMVAAAANAGAFEKLESNDPFPWGYTPVRLDDPSWQLLIQRDLALGKEVEQPPVGVRALKRYLHDALAEAVAASVDAAGALPGDAVAAAAVRAPVRSPADPGGGDWYVLQCLYERPQCGRACAPVVSDTTEPFRLASFFDPAAPARTLQVALPVDTTPAGLRKYDRNVVFMLSDELRRQLSRVKSMKDLSDGNIGAADSSVGFGVACSLSIPIITICALILLMVLVSLLNIIFWWMPFFKICFPVPKLEAKKA